MTCNPKCYYIVHLLLIYHISYIYLLLIYRTLSSKFSFNCWDGHERCRLGPSPGSRIWSSAVPKSWRPKFCEIDSIYHRYDMFVYIYMYIYTYYAHNIHTCNIYIYTYLCIHAYCIYMYIVCVYIYIYMHIVYIYIYTHVYVHIVYIYIYIHTCILYIHIYTIGDADYLGKALNGLGSSSPKF